MTRPADQIPVHLLTGFLGAGKTTLLNRLLGDPALQDTALIVNEFGLVPVDHDLVREGRERPAVTTTGCICCTLGSDLRASLGELLHGRDSGALPPFSRVIVETTGLADPAPIINSLIPGGVPARSLSDHSVARAFRLSSVIAVVDVEGAEAVLEAHPESVRQVAFADHAVLTRTDHAPAGDWPEALRRINPGLRVHDGADPAFAPAELLGTGSYAAFGKGQDVGQWLAEEAGRDRAVAAGGHLHDLNRHGAVRAVPLVGADPVEPAALQRFLDRLAATPGNGLLRVKGLVALRDDPGRPAVVHAVGHRVYPVARLDAWPGGDRQTRLVVIGTDLDEAALRRDFAVLAAGSPADPVGALPPFPRV